MFRQDMPSGEQPELAEAVNEGFDFDVDDGPPRGPGVGFVGFRIDLLQHDLAGVLA